MAFGAELVARLGLDPSAFQRGLSAADTAAGGFGKALQRKLGMQDAFKGVVAQLGISVENIAEKIAGAVVGGTAEGFKEAADLFDQQASLIEQRVMQFGDPKQRAAFLAREMNKALAEQEKAAQDPGRLRVGAEAASQKYNEMSKWNPLRLFTAGIYGSIAAANYEADRQKAMGAAGVRVSALTLAQEGEKKRRAQEEAAIDKQLADAREARFQRELEVAGKVAHLTGKKAAAELAVEQAGDDTVARKKAEIELDRIAVQLLEAQKALEEEVNRTREENLRLEKEQAAERKKEREQARQLLDAEASVDKAQKDIDTARDDQLRVSIQEAATGAGYVTQGNSYMARRILSLEARAKRLMQSGATDYRDESGNMIGAEAGSRRLQSHAEALRNKAEFLTHADRNPFEGAIDSLTKSEKHLDAIKAALAEEAK